MKKIWLPLLLLLLLMIICVWKHADDFNQPIEYTITQHGKSYTLDGKFVSSQQPQALTKSFAKNGAMLKSSKNTFDELLVSQGSIGVVESITSLFVKRYKDGKIVYRDKILTVEGIVDGNDAKEKMSALLSHAQCKILDHTKVVVPKPIAFVIEDTHNGYVLSGSFMNQAQKHTLIQAIKAEGVSVEDRGVINPALIEKRGIIGTVSALVPDIVKRFQDARIRYQDRILTVDGKAMKKRMLDKVAKDLSGAKVKVANNTVLNLAAIKQEEERKAKVDRLKAEQEAKARAATKRKAAEEAARRKAEEEAKAEAEAEKRAAKAAAEKRAKEEEAARLKAEQEAARLKAEQEAKARLEAEQKAAEEAARVKASVANMAVGADIANTLEKMKKQREEAKANIAKLLQVENIEFDSGKSTLTPMGEATVEKLALILNQYPLIKIEIAGHTDSDGNDAFNLKLSQTRVDKVKKELAKQGVSQNRVKAIGYGETRPLVPNTTAENKQKNRRVEIIILGE